MTTTTPETPQAPTRPKLSPRKRAQRFRLAQYALLVIVVAALALTVDWPAVRDSFFAPEDIKLTLTSGLGTALKNTIIYTAGAFVIGLVLGTVLALMRLSSVGPYRWFATAWIEFFRGLPALLVLLVFGTLSIAFPGLVIPFDPYGTVWVGLGIVASAYMAETIRAGIQAVPKGQVEAARSLGMTPGASTRKIVLPQALRIVIPPLTNELILLIKDSSLVFILGISTTGFELTKYGRDLGNQTAGLTPLTVAGLCYLVITLPLSVLVRRMEARQRKER
ncbi:amino acid ABC transporter membrane protein (PAAT family) [Knoellia remsis]|uniref:Amino acid ABC transporter membrane protein (PAAT family) n=1 Tax=Knoellia remsis TaxID=407159 RepID=A0A2T0UQU7_9MICO|nr:amino acid ABC transporter permease [Knoellia remsis]PRY60305.1 amino acid ABC transporter membrane protein (PAAT family) [Knoellia remsis]